MLFDQVKRKHILQGIKDFEEKGYPDGFGPSSTYDLIVDGKHYSTKAIMAYANYHASGEIPKNSFDGGLGTDCFLVLEREGFKVEKKPDYGRSKQPNYWVFQGNPKVFDFEAAIADGSLDNFTVTAHRDKIKTGDKVILWITGENAGCYALAEITSEPKKVSVSRDDKHWKAEDPNDIKAGIRITHDFYKSPILWSRIKQLDEFSNFKGGNQGTNFSATESEFKALLGLIGNKIKKQYWLYSPGEDANMWDEYSEKGIMGLGWDAIGDLAQYTSSDDIKEALDEAYGGDGSKKNIVLALDDFKNEIKIGDVIIVKKGRTKLLGYGIVTSKYTYEPSRTKHQHIREVDWKLKGSWAVPFPLVLKTLTDITKYKSEHPEHEKYSDYLMAIMGVERPFQINTSPVFKKIINSIKPALEEKGFDLSKIYKNYVRLSNKQTIPDKKEAHYELAYRKKEICVELHFEDKGSNRMFKEKLGALPNPLEWFKWYDGNSIRYSACSINDPGLQEKLVKGLQDFDKIIGARIRAILNNDDPKSEMIPINKILYGPPGTGKTYTLKENYFPLYTTTESSITPEKHFESVVKSCSWWEVIAIALIQLGSSKVNAIYEHKWVQKKEELSNSKTVKPTIWGQLQSHTVESCSYVNVKSKQQPLIFNKTEDSLWEVLETEVQNQVPELYALIDKVEHFQPNPDNTVERYRFVTFHQSFSYEDFIEGIKPVMTEHDEENSDLGYKIEDGIFKEICKEASLDPNNRYAIFIDEINRGNVSAIFGELITLIEIDKRKGAENEMSIDLPYSKMKFSVPSNLDIYGTMNTADRSVEALDTALRRRFEFQEMMPDLLIISKEMVSGISLSKVLDTINKRIELLIDCDHTIGHSYFIKIKSKQALADAFNNKIVPLLQEYFYGDYGKIGLVLGQGFVKKLKNNDTDFADFDYENANDFKVPTFILTQVTGETVIEAIHQLLGDTKEEPEIE